MKKLSLIMLLFCSLEHISGAQTVTIGTQVWMTKNLDVTKFRNGDPIPEANTVEEWVKAGENKQPAWCYYENNPANGTKYGKLYNWYAVNDPRGLAPVGYHVPSDAEWTRLKDFLGSDAGKKIKNTSGWNSYKEGGAKTCPNCASWNAEYRRQVACHTCKNTRRVSVPEVTKSGNGTNSSGFSGLPGGFRTYNGKFTGIGYTGFWYSSTRGEDSHPYHRTLFFDNGTYFPTFNGFEGEGLSVRCLRD
jgi:uncharacterized protein (TIGR02145 family)